MCQYAHAQETTMSVYVHLYLLAAINNMTTGTGTHTLHIIGTCPQTNMPATSHMYIPLH